MLILLYSDTNYVLDGFHAEFSVTDCPNNCTHHGKCINNTCFCENDWGGKDCSRALCPNNCSGAGVCGLKRCECNSGYSGQSCSLHKTHPEGNRYVFPKLQACTFVLLCKLYDNIKLYICIMTFFLIFYKIAFISNNGNECVNKKSKIM